MKKIGYIMSDELFFKNLGYKFHEKSQIFHKRWNDIDINIANSILHSSDVYYIWIMWKRTNFSEGNHYISATDTLNAVNKQIPRVLYYKEQIVPYITSIHSFSFSRGLNGYVKNDWYIRFLTHEKTWYLCSNFEKNIHLEFHYLSELKAWWKHLNRRIV